MSLAGADGGVVGHRCDLLLFRQELDGDWPTASHQHSVVSHLKEFKEIYFTSRRLSVDFQMPSGQIRLDPGAPQQFQRLHPGCRTA